MEFPVTLRAAIEQRAAQYTPAQLKALSQQLTLRYHTQSGRGQSLLSQGDEALAYAAVRMPATFGAVCGALEHTLPALSVLPSANPWAHRHCVSAAVSLRRLPISVPI